MDKTNYQKLSDEELKKTLKDLNLMVMQSYSFTETAKVKRQNRPQIRKEIAKIKTEQRARLRKIN